MAATLSASKLGLARIEQARKEKGWTIEDDQWLLAASKILHPEQDWQPGCYARGCSDVPSFREFMLNFVSRFNISDILEYYIATGKCK